MVSNNMAAIKYKMKSYKGCPCITIMGFAMDMIGYSIGIGCVGSFFSSFSQGEIVKGFVWVAVAIAFFIISTKLSMKYEHWGRTEEAKAGKREAEQLRDATQEKRDKYAKQKKGRRYIGDSGSGFDYSNSFSSVCSTVDSICFECGVGGLENNNELKK